MVLRFWFKIAVNKSFIAKSGAHSNVESGLDAIPLKRDKKKTKLLFLTVTTFFLVFYYSMIE